MPKLEKLPERMHINAKCSDLFSAVFYDSDGKDVADYIGYVPDFMPGQHWGDYVELEIDLATGQIKNWTPPSLKAINDALEGEKEKL